MVFSSITFLYYFMPFILVLYYLAPPRLKNLVLLLASLMFYAWGEIRFLGIMLLLSLSDFICGKAIEKNRGNLFRMRLFLGLDLAVNLFILFFFKYSDFFIANINQLTGLSIPLLNIPLPIGVSFNTFQSMSYIIDVYRRTTTCEKSYYNYLTYTTLFPQIIAGPIVRYVTVEDELDKRNITSTDLYVGLRRFLIGLGKKVLIANNVGILWTQIATEQIVDMSVALYWLGILAYAFQIYFDFSGYSDMAIGLARIFGLYFDENFNYPYISRSITEFWHRWHITLSSWFKDYVYIPLGGNRCSKFRHILNLLIVWGLTGFWHGASWNFIIWGLYFAILLILEKYLLKKLLPKLPIILQHLYATILILLSWVIFYFEDLGELIGYLKGLFFLQPYPFINATGIYYYMSYSIIMIIAALCATPIFHHFFEVLRQKNCYPHMLSILGYLSLLIAATAYLVNTTYNPFLYFRF